MTNEPSGIAAAQKKVDSMNTVSRKPFNTAQFLASEGSGRSVLHCAAKERFFSQGSECDAVYYLQDGRAKLTVISKKGKEATVTLLAAGDFFGEDSMAGGDARRTASASAVSACVALRIARDEMLRALHEEREFSDFFMKFILARGIRTQADLIDQLFNSSERRLARALLMMADYGKPGEPEALIPPVTQDNLAEMIGTTRSRVSFFMNRFRKLGYIDYHGRIRVNKLLLDAVLHDELPEENASRPKLLDPPLTPALFAKRAKRAGVAAPDPS
jgi:CRP-like cAMP-binding protein